MIERNWTGLDWTMIGLVFFMIGLLFDWTGLDWTAGGEEEKEKRVW